MMTPGVLLKKLNGDPQLRQYTHIVIDEVRSNSSVIILVIVQF
jgi:HrpA-like RNA helicase